jgi:hypothetical protein
VLSHSLSLTHCYLYLSQYITCKLTPPLFFTEVPFPRQKCVRSCFCAYASMIFLLELETVLMLWSFCLQLYYSKYNLNLCYMIIKFEDTKGVIRIRISKKSRQHNGRKKKYKRTNNNLQNIYIKLKIK